jgi:hypothetical protein
MGSNMLLLFLLRLLKNTACHSVRQPRQNSSKSAHPQGLPQRVAVDAASHILHCFTHQHGCNATGSLNHLCTSAAAALLVGLSYQLFDAWQALLTWPCVDGLVCMLAAHGLAADVWDSG